MVVPVIKNCSTNLLRWPSYRSSYVSRYYTWNLLFWYQECSSYFQWQNNEVLSSVIAAVVPFQIVVWIFVLLAHLNPCQSCCRELCSESWNGWWSSVIRFSHQHFFDFLFPHRQFFHDRDCLWSPWRVWPLLFASPLVIVASDGSATWLSKSARKTTRSAYQFGLLESGAKPVLPVSSTTWSNLSLRGMENTNTVYLSTIQGQWMWGESKGP